MSRPDDVVSDALQKRDDASSSTIKTMRRVKSWKVNIRRPSFLVCDIDELQVLANTFQHYDYIDGGSGYGGIFLANTSEGVLVVKQESEPIPTLFANFLGLRMSAALFGDSENSGPNFKFAWSIPSLRLLHRDQPEFRRIVDNLNRLEPLRTDGMGSDIPRISRLAQSCYILIIEFVPGKSLFGLHPDRSRSLLDRSMLKTLGSTLLLDLLINNYDRLPTVWNNSGNAANIMFFVDDDEATSADPDDEKKSSPKSKVDYDGISLIDQTVTAIKHEQQRGGYMQKVDKFARAVLGSDGEAVLEAAEPLRSFFLINTFEKCDIGDDGKLAIVEGFVQTVKYFQSNDVLLESILEAGQDTINAVKGAHASQDDFSDSVKVIEELQAFVREVYYTIKAV